MHGVAPSSRLPALDALRGLALLLMVLYHAAFDLRFFYGWPLDVLHGGWLILARVSAILFLLIAGVCFALSWEHTSPQRRLCKALRRFAVLALAAALVSAATWLIAPQDFVQFGILHLFAFATLLLPLFAPLKFWNALLGLLVLILSLYKLPTTHYRLIDILIGYPPPFFSSLDYFPLAPWFGVLLIGTSLGHILPIKYLMLNSSISPFLHFSGRHSLAIYLIHQPILLSIMAILLGPPPPLTPTVSSTFVKATADRRGERESQPLLVIKEDVEFQNDENKPPKL